jgi:4'-phosphopantetheinyl transferase
LSHPAHDSFLALLSSDELARTSTYRFDDPRRRFVIARGALRKLLGKYLDASPTAIEIGADQNQKPYLLDKHSKSGLHFNVSHSGNLAVIAFAKDCEVGVDVEELREVSHLEQIARRFFHPLEISTVLSAPEPDRNLAFLRCWTGKEAILKGLGTGIVGNLAAFQVPPGNAWQGWIEYSDVSMNAIRSRCWLEQLTPAADYAAAIACVESKRTVRLYAFET